MEEEADSNLEMRCSADGAWYDGTLKVLPESNDLIVVHFNDFDEDEDETFPRSELSDPEKLRSRVRVRSMQLQDSQCKRVYDSQKICGCLDDGEDRKYYDATITSIVQNKHSIKDGGDECLCKFTLLWADGPRKGEYTEVGCAEVCFLSLDAPEDDPVVKNLRKGLASDEEQPRRKLVKSTPKSVSTSGLSPRPRTPSPSLELAPSKKQPSKMPSPPAAQPNQEVLELVRTKSLPIGSKKKRIMQAEGLTDLARVNDKLEMAGGQTSAPKDSRPRFEEGGGEPTGHGYESDAPEWRLVSGGSEGKKGSEQAAQKKRLVKGKAGAVTPEVVDREEGAGEDVMQDTPRRTFKERLKSSIAKMVPSPIEGVVRDKDVRQGTIIQSLGERVNLIKTANMAVPDAAAVAPPPRDEDKIVQSLEERVKLKTAKKNSAASSVDAHKVSLQRTGKQVDGKRIMKRQLIQLNDPTPDPLSSKYDKLVNPINPSKPEDIAAEPNNIEPAQRSAQKRKAGRPRKLLNSEPAKPATASTIAKTQLVAETFNERSPREEELVDANAENCLSEPANKNTKKRSQDEERSQHDSDNIVPYNSSQDYSTLDLLDGQLLASDPANKRKKKKMIIGDHEGVLLDDDTISDKSARTNDMAEDHHEDHIPLVSNPDEAFGTSHHLEKISMGERLRDIENKYRSRSCFSTSQAAQELIILAATEHYRENSMDQEHVRVSTPHETSASHRLGDHQDKADEMGASGKRRRVGKRQFVISDDENEDVTMGPNARKELIGMSDRVQDECSPGRQTAASDAKNPNSASDEMHVGTSTRLLLLENLETGASALDVMQLLQRHTDGVCAVHVLPVLDFQVSAIGFALYRDSGSALQALQWLTLPTHFVVSPTGRPWIVSLSKKVYGPGVYGFVAYTAYKSDDPDLCGVISDQPHAHDFVVVTKRDKSAYFQALQRSKTYEEQKKWRKELYERIVQHDKEG